MKNWKTVRFEDISREITVGFVGSMADEYIENGVLFLRSQNIEQYKLNLSPSQVRYISKEFHKKLKKSALFPGDIAVVRTGYPGTSAVIPNNVSDLNCSDLVIIRPDHDLVDSRFLCYYLNSPYGMGEIEGNLVGAAQQHFNVGVAKRIKIKLPPLPIQKKIASILSAYDELIENNNQRIKLLEEMAEEIYKEWFVRLRFPGHENTPIHDGVPEGWRKAVFGNIVNVKKGKNITQATITEGSIPVVAGGIEPAYYHNEANTVSPVITVSASGANAGYINFYYQDIWASDCSYIDKTLTGTIFYVYLSLKTRQKEVFHLQKGSAQPHVYPKDLMALDTLKPEDDIINKFEKLISPFFFQIKTLIEKNQVLKETRDLLLPRLISGKLSVEHLLEESEPAAIAAETDSEYHPQ